MSSIYSSEKFMGYPIPNDGVSFGAINASNVTTLISINNVIFSGSYSFDTVTITLKGITTPPFNKPTSSNIGSQQFSFRGKNWVITDVVEGYKFNIGGTTKYESWSITGVDISNPRVKVS